MLDDAATVSYVLDYLVYCKCPDLKVPQSTHADTKLRYDTFYLLHRSAHDISYHDINSLTGLLERFEHLERIYKQDSKIPVREWLEIKTQLIFQTAMGIIYRSINNIEKLFTITTDPNISCVKAENAVTSFLQTYVDSYHDDIQRNSHIDSLTIHLRTNTKNWSGGKVRLLFEAPNKLSDFTHKFCTFIDKVEDKLIKAEQQDSITGLKRKLVTPVQNSRFAHTYANGTEEIIHTGDSEHRKRTKWNAEDTDLLVTLVKENGTQWSMSLKEGQKLGQFKGRMSMDLRDKVRNLVAGGWDVGDDMRAFFTKTM